MIKNILFIFLFCLMMFSCKINQKINTLKQGIWLENIVIDSIVYKSKGRFLNSNEIGKWKYYENGKRTKKEIFKKYYTIKTFYHHNGKVSSTGRTKTNDTGKMLHWFYDGIWKFYNDKGQLIRIRIYENSNLISDKEIPMKQ